jgi:hypothetical protein
MIERFRTDNSNLTGGLAFCVSRGDEEEGYLGGEYEDADNLLFL